MQLPSYQLRSSVTSVSSTGSIASNKSEILEEAPSVLYVSGRFGFNESLNGTYNKLNKLLHGKVIYKKKDSNWVIRWYETSTGGRWFFDHRGIQIDEICAAFVAENVPDPSCITKPFYVYNGTKWEKDPLVKVKKTQNHPELEDFERVTRSMSKLGLDLDKLNIGEDDSSEEQEGHKFGLSKLDELHIEGEIDLYSHS